MVSVAASFPAVSTSLMLNYEINPEIHQTVVGDKSRMLFSYSALAQRLKKKVKAH